MTVETPDSLCARCFYRADSRRRCVEFAQLPRAPGVPRGLVCDPAPRAECKRHEGYGHVPAETRAACCDSRSLDGGGE